MWAQALLIPELSSTITLIGNLGLLLIMTRESKRTPLIDVGLYKYSISITIMLTCNYLKTMLYHVTSAYLEVLRVQIPKKFLTVKKPNM